MEVQVVHDGTAPMRLVLVGRLDATGTEQVEVLFMARIRAAATDVLVDMTAVSFVGSLGIRLLISAARLAERAGRKVVLFGAQPPVSEVFRTVALDDLIPVAADEAAALAQLVA